MEWQLMKRTFILLAIVAASIAFVKSVPSQVSAIDDSTATPTVAPTAATAGAALTGNYRNLFAEWGKSEADIDSRVNAAYHSLFNPGGDDTVYYETGNDMAYVEDIGNNDVRTEGMSYGMMITVMMDDQSKFNKLWKFVKTHMQCPNSLFDCGAPGQRDGYSSWHVNATEPFYSIDPNPAPDGEEYFTSSLLFAAGRWGNGTGIFDYQAEAQTILDAMLKDDRPNGFHSMFDLSQKLVNFGPEP